MPHVMYPCLFHSNVKVTYDIMYTLLAQTKFAVIVVEFLTHIKEFLDSESQLGHGLSGLRFLWHSSIPPGKCQNSISIRI
jgi:hypothetical protein